MYVTILDLCPWPEIDPKFFPQNQKDTAYQPDNINHQAKIWRNVENWPSQQEQSFLYSSS